MEKLRPSLTSTACAFVLLKGDRRPAIVLKEMVPSIGREGRDIKLKELACIQLCVDDPGSVQLMAEVDENQVKATNDLVNFVGGSRARIYFLIPH